MNDIIVGIDLGTTNSAIGVVDSGFPMLLADDGGKRIMPSAVWYGPSGEIEVGHKALRRRPIEGSRVITSVKRLMGRELSVEESESLGGKTAEQVSADILRELKRRAEWRLGKALTKAVITVPAYFHDGQRNATKRAGELAGWEVVRILNEPTAAALSYGLDQLGERSRVAVYDLGGGTFDLSILEMQDGVFQVLSTHGDTQLGGDDLDRVLAEKMIGLAGLEAASVGHDAWIRWRVEAERVKCALSERALETFAMPFFDGVNSFSREVTRVEFSEWIQPWVARTLSCCRRALSDARLESNEIDALVLVGGSSRIPVVRTAVESLFGRVADLSQHPDEAIALGATIQAGVISGAMKHLVLLDVTPLSLGIETLGGLMNVLIPRNTTIPCKAGELFTNAVHEQKAMRVRVLQGEREMARDNWELGIVDIPFKPAAKGQARIGVQLHIDENGILEVLARDVKTGIDQILTIRSSAVDVSDESVEKMVGDSVEHAFSDMAERIFTEAKLKAEELLPAVEQALELGRQWLSAKEIKTIETARAEVCQALLEKEPNSLKAAVQRLDTATEALAAKIVQQAMDEALDRQLSL
ncbi:MAG TPA: molecular chaperone DnaK [Verrucomicrobiales bacterium]|nr:molecular chaperone DnaK [Verrucomicrobiales bacterium]